jgi:hypothetical protein
MSGQGLGRTTVGESGSGDLYAGHDGNVYKKTDAGWQNYHNGGWQQVDAPERAWGDPANREAMQSRGSSGFGEPRSQAASRDFSQVNRDFGARQQGSRQFQQRFSSMRGMARTGGRGRRR